MSLASPSVSNPSTDVRYSPISGLIVICGATATGKSGLAIALAQRLLLSRINSAILSADSRQVYREFNIGTAKPSVADQQIVLHHLIDICDPTETLTVADYQLRVQALIGTGEDGRQEGEGRGQEAGREREEGEGREEPGARRQEVEESTCKGISSDTPTVFLPTSSPTHIQYSFPLLVGGTGLYIRSITKGLIIPRVPPQPELRSQLQALGQKACYAMLQQVDPKSAKKIHANDQVRTLRSLEVFYTTGLPISAQQGENPPAYPILHIGLDCLEASNLQQRIAHRAKQMVAQGFVAEVESLCHKYGEDLPLMNTLGYAEFRDYLSGRLSLDAALEQTIVHTRQFAKRQRTWFHADSEIHWFDADAPNLEEVVWQYVEQFINKCSVRN